MPICKGGKIIIYIIGFIIILFLLIILPTVRCLLLNIWRAIPIAIIDIFYYIVQMKYNNCKTGEIVAFCGLFGKGKTLSSVHKIVELYKTKNNKRVWCPRRKKFVTQKIKVISNVSLKIPYENFVTLEQIVYCAEKNRQYDDDNNTLTVTLVLGDEFSVQMNSRSFKTNIDPLFLNTILTCRHHYISLYYTAQRFGHVDALLRQVTSYVIDCNKIWRLQGSKYYDAWQLENASSPDMIKPYRRTCWFVSNYFYNAYDTLACVGNLKKSMLSGDMISEDDIIKLQCNNPDTSQILKPSKKLLKLRKKVS